MLEAKIIRGYYLTGVGQEPLAYHFKIVKGHADFDTLEVGDIALTFYQNEEAISSIPALIRVDSVISNEAQVFAFLNGEKKDHLPMLPIVAIYDQFDPIRYSQVMESFEELRTRIKSLAKVKYIQGDLFEFLEEEEEE